MSAARPILALALLFTTSATFAQPVFVVPNAFANAEANTGTGVPVQQTGQPRTYQMQIATSQLGSLPVGASLTGLRWRMDAGQASSFPPTTATWSDYDIMLAQAANPIGAMSPTFADNMIAPVTVRTGPLTVNPGAFPNSGSPTAFGPLFSFSTPYVYQGGDLVLYFSHAGSNITQTAFLDAADSDTPGYGTDFRAQFAIGFHAPTAGGGGTDFQALVTLFQFAVAVPEPATWAMLVLTLFGFAAARAWSRRSAVPPVAVAND
jgi:hypothetical protein